MERLKNNMQTEKKDIWNGKCKKITGKLNEIFRETIYGKKYINLQDSNSATNKRVSNTYKLDKNIVTFGDILSIWMKNNQIRLKGGTITKYQNIIDTHIMPELGSTPINEISSTMINEFLVHKLKNGRLDGSGGLSASYVRSIMIVISSALKYAVAEELCLPLRTPIYKPIIEKKEICIFNLTDQRKLEKVLMENFNEMNAGVLISLQTGLRIGEICALSWEDVDLNHMIIHVRHTIARVKSERRDNHFKTIFIIDTPKTRSSIRDIPISSKLSPILFKLKENAISTYVISRNKSFVNTRTFEYHYHQTLKSAGLPSLNFHCIRHTFATRCVEAGIDIKSLSEILGHSNVGITLNTYVHSSLELKRNQLEKLNTL